jgi:predicted acyl esterase
LDAICTAPDTAFIAVLQDVDKNGNAINVTAGYLRASLRDVDEAASKHGAPFLPCRIFEPVPIEEKVSYRIPIVPNARRFRTGHQLRLYLTTDDQNADRPALLEFRHASVGTSSFNTIFSSSRLLLPVLL